MSTVVDIDGLQTERQARLLDSEGRARRQKEEDPVTLAMDYLVRVYEKLALPKCWDFVISLQNLLREMQKDAEKRTQTNPFTGVTKPLHQQSHLSA